MPNRILREGINSSARVNRLSLGAEVLYRRLMSVADDYGRYYASPATVRGACFPTAPDKACEQDVINWLAECQQIASKDTSALITVYDVTGCLYLQINDFKQQTRTKSKFPEPVINLLADCEQNASTSRISESISEVVVRSAESGTVALALLDDFGKFSEACHLAELSASETDIAAARVEWKRLDFQQKIEAVQGIKLRVQAGEFSDPGFRPLPQNYLKNRIWQREIRVRRQEPKSVNDRAIEIVQQNLERDRLRK